MIVHRIFFYSIYYAEVSSGIFVKGDYVILLASSFLRMGVLTQPFSYWLGSVFIIKTRRLGLSPGGNFWKKVFADCFGIIIRLRLFPLALALGYVGFIYIDWSHNRIGMGFIHVTQHSS